MISTATERRIVDWATERMSAQEMEVEARGAVAPSRRRSLIEMACARYDEEGNHAAAIRLRTYLTTSQQVDAGQFEEAAASLAMIGEPLDSLRLGLEIQIARGRLILACISADGVSIATEWIERLEFAQRILPDERAVGPVDSSANTDADPLDGLRRRLEAALANRGSVVDARLAIDEARVAVGAIPSRDERIRAWISTQSPSQLSGKVAAACDRWHELGMPLEVFCGGAVRDDWVRRCSHADRLQAEQGAAQFLQRIRTSHELGEMLDALDHAVR